MSSVSAKKYVMPLCLLPVSSVVEVRASSMQRFAAWAKDVQTFWPLTTQPPSTRSARLRRPARSLPAPGSEKPWHQMSSPLRIRGRYRSRCAWVPCTRIVGPASRIPSMLMPTGACRRADSALKIPS